MTLGATLIPYTAKSVRRQSAAPAAKRSPSPKIGALVFLVFLLIASSIFYIATHIKVVNLGYKINHEAQLKETIIEENKKLSLEIARLQSPTRIEREATETLGLKLPGVHQIVYFSRWDDNLLAKVAGDAPIKPEVPVEKPKALPKAVNPAAKPVAVTAKAPSPALPAAKTTAATTNVKPKTATAEVKTLSTSKKKSPEVIVATLVNDRAPKPATVSKNIAVKKREGVPAVLLDPMP